MGEAALLLPATSVEGALRARGLGVVGTGVGEERREADEFVLALVGEAASASAAEVAPLEEGPEMDGILRGWRPTGSPFTNSVISEDDQGTRE